MTPVTAENHFIFPELLRKLNKAICVSNKRIKRYYIFLTYI